MKSKFKVGVGEEVSHRMFHFDFQNLGFGDGRKGGGILGHWFILCWGWRLYSLGGNFGV